jgi:O-acetyl-ADP-ribose deacetylase (regulator of RNase III)
MIEFRKGDWIESGAEASVNAVNTAGMIGRGIALRLKETFPENFAAYADAWNRSTGGESLGWSTCAPG